MKHLAAHLTENIQIETLLHKVGVGMSSIFHTVSHFVHSHAVVLCEIIYGILWLKTMFRGVLSCFVKLSIFFY